MHEFSIAQELVEAVTIAARNAAMRRVRKVVCRIGALRRIESSLLLEAFQIAGENTICADAELKIEQTCMRAQCPLCKRRFDVREWVWICPICGAGGSDGQGGDELDLLSIEGETDDLRTAD